MTPNSRLQHVLDYSVNKSTQKFVYFIECQGFIKIGLANNLGTRLSNLQIGCPFDQTLIASFRVHDTAEIEAELHNLFDKYRARGEWFRLPPDTVKLIALLGLAQSPTARAEPPEPIQPLLKIKLPTGKARLKRGWDSYGVKALN